MNTLTTILALMATIGGARPDRPGSRSGEDGAQDANAFFGNRPACAAGQHDDGTGACVRRGCATSYHDGGAGECVGEGGCSAAFHDNGAGKCVAKGCASGFVWSKESTCVGPAGLVWNERFNARRWVGVAASADGHKLIGAVENGPLLTSEDGGSSWTHRYPKDVWNGVASSADGSRLVAVGHAVYLSADSGATWNRVEPLPSTNPDQPWKKPETRTWTAVASSADGKKLIVALQAGALYRSEDGGAKWTAVGSEQAWTAVTSSADGTKLAAAVANGPIHVSPDGGATWIESAAAPRSWRALVSSSDGARLLASGVEKDDKGAVVLTSLDWGKSWKERKLVRPWSCIVSSADGSRLLAGEAAGRLQLSTDGGKTWTERAPIQNWRGVASSADGSTLIGVTYGPESGAGTVFTSSGPLR